MALSKLEKVFQIVSNISKILRCSVCLELSKDPVYMTCGHFFCRECVITILKSKFKASCPLCLKQFTKRCLNGSPSRVEVLSKLNCLTENIKQLCEEERNEDTTNNSDNATVETSASITKSNCPDSSQLNTTNRRSKKRKSDESQGCKQGSSDKVDHRSKNSSSNDEDGQFITSKSKKSCQRLLSNEGTDQNCVIGDDRFHQDGKLKSPIQQSVWKKQTILTAKQKRVSSCFENHHPSLTSSDIHVLEDIEIVKSSDKDSNLKTCSSEVQPCYVRVENVNEKESSDKDPYAFISDESEIQKSSRRIRKSRQSLSNKGISPLCKGTNKIQQDGNKDSNKNEVVLPTEKVPETHVPIDDNELSEVEFAEASIIPDSMANQCPNSAEAHQNINPQRCGSKTNLLEPVDITKENTFPVKSKTANATSEDVGQHGSRNKCVGKKSVHKKVRNVSCQRSTPARKQEGIGNVRTSEEVPCVNLQAMRNDSLQCTPTGSTRKPKKTIPGNLGNDKPNEDELDCNTTITKSPGWSKVKQMNKDFHLKRVPILDMLKSKSHRTSFFTKKTRLSLPCLKKKSPTEKMDLSPENTIVEAPLFSASKDIIPSNENAHNQNCSFVIPNSDDSDNGGNTNAEEHRLTEVANVRESDNSPTAIKLNTDADCSEIISCSRESNNQNLSQQSIVCPSRNDSNQWPNSNFKHDLKSREVMLANVVNTSSIPESSMPICEIDEEGSQTSETSPCETPTQFPSVLSMVRENEKKICSLSDSSKDHVPSKMKSPEFSCGTELSHPMETDQLIDKQIGNFLHFHKKKGSTITGLLHNLDNSETHNTEDICREILNFSELRKKNLMASSSLTKPSTRDNDLIDSTNTLFHACKDTNVQPAEYDPKHNSSNHPQLIRNNELGSAENSFSKPLKGNVKTKVIKRICLTLDEIHSYFNNSNDLGTAEEICNVPLLSSGMKLQLTVSDQTFNISILKELTSQPYTTHYPSSDEKTSIANSSGPSPFHIIISEEAEKPNHSSSSKGKPETVDFCLQFPSQPTSSKSSLAVLKKSIPHQNFPDMLPIEIMGTAEFEVSSMENGTVKEINKSIDSTTSKVQKVSEDVQEHERNRKQSLIGSKNQDPDTICVNLPSPNNNERSIVDVRSGDAMAKSIEVLSEKEFGPKVVENFERLSKSILVEEEVFAEDVVEISPNWDKNKKVPTSPANSHSSGGGKEDLFSDVDPFEDSDKFLKSTPNELDSDTSFLKLIAEDEYCSSDPDMIFAQNLVAPLKNLTKKKELKVSEHGGNWGQTDCWKKQNNDVEKPTVKRNKNRKARMIESESSDEEISCQIPTIKSRERYEAISSIFDSVQRGISVLKEPGTSYQKKTHIFGESSGSVLTTKPNSSRKTSSSPGVSQLKTEIKSIAENIKELEAKFVSDYDDSENESNKSVVQMPNLCTQVDDAGYCFSENCDGESNDIFNEQIPPTPPIFVSNLNSKK